MTGLFRKFLHQALTGFLQIWGGFLTGFQSKAKEKRKGSAREIPKISCVKQRVYSQNGDFQIKRSGGGFRLLDLVGFPAKSMRDLATERSQHTNVLLESPLLLYTLSFYMVEYPNTDGTRNADFCPCCA